MSKGRKEDRKAGDAKNLLRHRFFYSCLPAFLPSLLQLGLPTANELSRGIVLRVRASRDDPVVAAADWIRGNSLPTLIFRKLLKISHFPRQLPHEPAISSLLLMQMNKN